MRWRVTWRESRNRSSPSSVPTHGCSGSIKSVVASSIPPRLSLWTSRWRWAQTTHATASASTPARRLTPSSRGACRATWPPMRSWSTRSVLCSPLPRDSSVRCTCLPFPRRDTGRSSQRERQDRRRGLPESAKTAQSRTGRLENGESGPSRTPGPPRAALQAGRRLDNVAKEASRHLSGALAAVGEETLGNHLSHLRGSARRRYVLWVDRWPGPTLRCRVLAPKIHPAGAAEHLVKAQYTACPRAH